MRPEQVQLQLVRSSLCLPPSISPMARARELVYNELTTGGNSIPALHLSIRFNHREKIRNSPLAARVVHFPGLAGRKKSRGATCALEFSADNFRQLAPISGYHSPRLSDWSICINNYQINDLRCKQRAWSAEYNRLILGTREEWRGCLVDLSN